MKAVITIFQFRRAVLPHLFMLYCYPVMKQAFPGSLDVWIIQDTGLAKGTIHTSAKVYSDAKRHLIAQWTDTGRTTRRDGDRVSGRLSTQQRGHPKRNGPS